MRFVHADPEFPDLLMIVAKERNLAPGLVEKDYWVTHVLWALPASGLEIWFKGGTSLSKGFGLVERFSEDLDLKIEPGTAAWLPRASNWRSEGAKATSARKVYFEALGGRLRIPGARVVLDPDAIGKAWRSATLRVTYPGGHLADLGGMAPFVQLEVGSARVTPFVPRDMTSFVHEKLAALGQLADYADNRPRGVRCVHPLVTLLEKLDALHRRFPNAAVEPAAFVRHYEDAARIIRAQANLPPLVDYASVAALASDMLGQKQIAARPAPADPAFAPAKGGRWDAIQVAHVAIAPLFWGLRISLDEACAIIRRWVADAV